MEMELIITASTPEDEEKLGWILRVQELKFALKEVFTLMEQKLAGQTEGAATWTTLRNLNASCQEVISKLGLRDLLND